MPGVHDVRPARDPQRREGPILDRIAGGEREIRIGSGNLLWSKVFVDDLADGIRLALEADVSGEVFNFAERRTVSMAQWFQWIIDEVDPSVRLVRGSNRDLPPDLQVSGVFGQHVLFDSSKAMAPSLGGAIAYPRAALSTSIVWHLRNAPTPRPG